MKHLCTALATALRTGATLLTSSFFLLPFSFAKTFDWPIDSPAAGARQFTAYHGETVRFNLQFRGAMTNLSPVAIYYQTNGMGRAEWFEPVPGTVFHPTNDCGAAFYRFFIRCTDPDGINYTANGSLRLLDSPGFEPSAVQLPAQSLDFARIEVLNPPWGEGPGNYAAVSNAAMNALSRAEAEAGFTEWECDPESLDSMRFSVRRNGDRWELRHGTIFVEDAEGSVDATSLYFTAAMLTATRTRLPTMADIPTNNVQLVNGAGYVTESITNGIASTNDVQLMPVHGGNGERLGEWVVSAGAGYSVGGVTRTGEYVWRYNFYENDSVVDISAETFETEAAALAATHITGYNDQSLTAIRTENPIIGYTLGSQTNKVLASTNDLARAFDLAAVRSVADAAASTNAAQSAEISSLSTSLAPIPGQISTLSSQMNAIGAHINAEDARFVSTNYNSATHMPEAYVEVKVSNSWFSVWYEMTRWNWFLGIYTNDFAAISAALATKGEREYAFYDGVTGEPAPDGFFWISQPRIAVAAGMSYRRYVDTGGAVWVLESNGMVADINGTTNGFFRVSDDEGNTQFEIVKGSSRTVSAAPGALTSESVMGVTHWFTTYSVTNASSAPVAMFCRDIGSPEWYAETDGSCPCNVSWTNPESGVYVCEWWAKSSEPKMFMKAEYRQGTESRIVQSAPVEMQYIVINGVKYTLGTATIDGKTVLTLTP